MLKMEPLMKTYKNLNYLNELFQIKLQNSISSVRKNERVLIVCIYQKYTRACMLKSRLSNKYH